jgi:hypothetical protein
MLNRSMPAGDPLHWVLMLGPMKPCTRPLQPGKHNIFMRHTFHFCDAWNAETLTCIEGDGGGNTRGKPVSHGKNA